VFPTLNKLGYSQSNLCYYRAIESAVYESESAGGAVSLGADSRGGIARG